MDVRAMLSSPVWAVLDSPVLVGDCVEVMRALPPASVDAVVTDPPYGIGFMGHEWDQPGVVMPEVREGIPKGQRRRANPMPSGFDVRNGQAMYAGRYDLSRSANQAFQDWCEVWAREVLRVLKPGGYLIAAGGARTYHRLTAGIEDAGFEIRDSIMHGSAEPAAMLPWVYGSGFPKSLNLDRALRAAQRCMCDVPRAAAEEATEPSSEVLLGGVREWGQGVVARDDVRAVREGVDGKDALPSGSPDEVRQVRAETAGASSGEAEQDVSGVRYGVPSSAEQQGQASTVPDMQRGGARARGSGAGAPEVHDAGVGQPRVEGRRDALAQGGQLPADQVRPGTRVGAADVPEGRLRDGAPADRGGDGGSAVVASGGGTSPRSRSDEQRPGELGTVAVQPTSQVGGAWPRCERCGLPVVPKGLGTALKPAWEPMVVARKPLIGSVAANVLAHGTGALNIDGCRVATGDRLGGGDQKADRVTAPHGEGWDRPWMSDPVALAAHAERVNENVARAEVLGRWPANVVLTHGEGCVCVGERRVATSRPASGPTLSATSRPASGPTLSATSSVAHGDFNGAREGVPNYADADGMETVEAWECVDGCPVAELDAQTGVLSSGVGAVKRASGEGYVSGSMAGRESRPAGTPNVEYGDQGGASRFFYVAKASRAERNAGLDGFEKKPILWSSGEQNPGSFQADGTEREAKNHHPTVKPIDLMRWLVRLVTPPGGVVLDPFAGSGTTGCACVLEGFDFVGIERDEGYARIAEARVRFWGSKPGGMETERVLRAEAERPERSGQLSIL